MSHDEKVSRLIFEVHRLEERITENYKRISEKLWGEQEAHWKTHAELEKEIAAIRKELEDLKK